MVNVYYRLVKAGKWDIDDVPDRWRAAVREKLNEG